MAATEINVGSSPQSFPNYPTKSRDDNGDWVVTERYWVKASSLIHYLPAHNATTNQNGSTVTDPDGNTLKCRRANVSEGSAPGVVEVTLTYAKTSVSLSIKPAPDNPRSVRMNRQDIPIDDERLLSGNGGPFTQAQIDDAKKRGHRTLPLFGVEYTYTDVDASFAWTESAIAASLQDTGTPTGVGSATASNWQLMGREIDETESETVIRSHYRYSGAGFVPL
jgi:hypothetical protein